MTNDTRHPRAPSTPGSTAPGPTAPRSPLAPEVECPLCGADLAPEHAHFRCRSCGWRDSCCD